MLGSNPPRDSQNRGDRRRRKKSQGAWPAPARCHAPCNLNHDLRPSGALCHALKIPGSGAAPRFTTKSILFPYVSVEIPSKSSDINCQSSPSINCVRNTQAPAPFWCPPGAPEAVKTPATTTHRLKSARFRLRTALDPQGREIHATQWHPTGCVGNHQMPKASV